MIPKINSNINDLASQIIAMLEQYLAMFELRAVIHFEIEGCYVSSANGASLNFEQANVALQRANIHGHLVPEFWTNQWEFVSDFNGQSPLEEARSAERAMLIIPQIFKQQGISQTIISPVVWSGDSRRMVNGSRHFFAHDSRQVHIPNAIQLNVSVNNHRGENIIAQGNFGYRLQQSFIETSQSCALLYLPEPMAYERLLLKEKYGLSDELCSPSDISGGHQGSIALYLNKGKHNQIMGETPLLYDQHQKVILSTVDWRKTARVEHRLGASSRFYNPYMNVIYALLNVIEAVSNEKAGKEIRCGSQRYYLPQNLHGGDNDIGAVELFNNESWFAQRINKIESYLIKMQESPVAREYQGLGEQLKQMFLAQYQQVKLIY